MSLSYNRVIIAGNLTRDPEFKFLANEQGVGNFGIAINRRFKGKDGETKEEVTFVDIEAWGRTAELAAQYLKKGSGCLIEGRLKLDSWEDKDGGKRQKLKVVADAIQFTGSPKREEGGAQEAPAPIKPAGGGVTGDEPPFACDRLTWG